MPANMEDFSGELQKNKPEKENERGEENSMMDLIRKAAESSFHGVEGRDAW